MHEVAIADVALDELDGAVGQRPREVVAPAAHEVVQDDDLAGAGLHELIGQVGADRSPAARDQDPLAADAVCAVGWGLHGDETCCAVSIFHGSEDRANVQGVFGR